MADASPWSCYSNYITCSPADGEHLLRFHKADYRADFSRINGHSFLRCDACVPATYFFAVFTTTPDSYATCYAISKESYDRYAHEAVPTIKSTPEMLSLLRDPNGRSLNPNWRPPR